MPSVCVPLKTDTARWAALMKQRRDFWAKGATCSSPSTSAPRVLLQRRISGPDHRPARHGQALRGVPRADAHQVRPLPRPQSGYRHTSCTTP